MSDSMVKKFHFSVNFLPNHLTYYSMISLIHHVKFTVKGHPRLKDLLKSLIHFK